MSALARARDLQRGWNLEFPTRFHKGSCVILPFRFIEVDRQKMAGVIRQQRINTDGVMASQMIVDHLIRDRNQQAMNAIGTFDARFFADTGPPFEKQLVQRNVYDYIIEYPHI